MSKHTIMYSHGLKIRVFRNVTFCSEGVRLTLIHEFHYVKFLRIQTSKQMTCKYLIYLLRSFTFIHRLEGRSWYTSHRGRLWIASTAQQTEKDVIDNVVEDYKRMYPGEFH